jgi:hypothetical protein
VANTANSIHELINPQTHALPPLTTRACGDCHQSPHSPGFNSAVAAHFKCVAAATCQACHSPDHASFRGPYASVTPEVHALIGFPLTSPHDQVACQKCHPNFGQAKSSKHSFPITARTADDCRDCHGDPHIGQFDLRGVGAKANCLACHSRDRFAPTLFDARHHSQTTFPLQGAHAATDCKKCHIEQTFRIAATSESTELIQTVRVFRGTAHGCGQCHRDAHSGQFAQGAFAGADCNACHQEQSFAPSRFTVQHHAQTAFPLTGAHRAVGCNECHKNVEDADGEHGLAAKRVASVRQFHGTPQRCDACHADVHEGAFAKLATPDLAGSPRDCALCHTTESFQEVKEQDFDHARWTGFALRGAHARAKCSACHPNQAMPNEAGRVFGKAAGRNCQDCHRDPHAGQFGETAEVSCAACHADGNNFSELIFDHQRDAKFPLDEIHARLQCAACHRGYRMDDGQVVTRYKPLGAQCADCHLPQSSSKRSVRQ